MRLRYAASTLATPWLALAALAVLLFQASSFNRFMTGELLLAADSAAILVMLVGPVLTGFSAFDAARHFSPSRAGVFTQVAARRRESAWLLFWSAAPIAVVFSAVTGARVANEFASHGHGTAMPATLATMFLHAVALVFFAAVGILVGRPLPPVAAGIVGLLVGYGVTMLGAGQRGVRFGPLDLGGASISRLGLELSPAFLAVQVAALLLVSLAVVAVARAVPPAPRQRLRRSLVGLGVVVLVMVAPVPGLPTSRWILAPEAPSSCVGTDPEICTYPEHADQADLADARIRGYAEALRQEQLSSLVPVKVHELRRSYTPDGAEMIRSVDLSEYDDSVEARRSLIHDLVTPVHCPQLIADVAPSNTYFDTVDRLAKTVAHAADPAVEATLWSSEPMTSEEARAALVRLWACDIA